MARYVVKEITRKEVEVLIALGIERSDGWCSGRAPVGTLIRGWPDPHFFGLPRVGEVEFVLLSPNPPEDLTSESTTD